MNNKTQTKNHLDTESETDQIDKIRDILVGNFSKETHGKIEKLNHVLNEKIHFLVKTMDSQKEASEGYFKENRSKIDALANSHQSSIVDLTKRLDSLEQSIEDNQSVVMDKMNSLLDELLEKMKLDKANMTKVMTEKLESHHKGISDNIEHIKSGGFFEKKLGQSLEQMGRQLKKDFKQNA